MEASLTEVKNRLGSLLARVEKGEEIIILRRGKEVARIVPPKKTANHLPSLRDFRSTIRVSGEPLSATVVRARNHERY
jgi:prevent-host-death family protein